MILLEFLPEIQWSIMSSHLWLTEITERDLPPSFDKKYTHWVETMCDEIPFFNDLHKVSPSSLYDIRGRRGGVIRLASSLARLQQSLIDDKILIVGSSNFDYLSYRCHPESVAIITNPIFINEFKHKIINKDIENCETAINTISDWQGYFLKYRLLTLGKLFTQLGKM